MRRLQLYPILSHDSPWTYDTMLIRSWCQPCKILGPVLQRLTGPESGADLVVVDVDDQPELAGEYKVHCSLFVLQFAE